MSHAPAFDTWLDRFFAAYYRRRPVSATFIGEHRYDDRLPNYSARGVDEARAEMAALLAELRGLPAESLSAAQSLDRRAAEGFLEIQLWEHGSAQFQAGNPCVYTGEAAFGILSLLRRPFAPLEQRLESAAVRMEGIPQLLAQGQANVRSAPLAWTDRAIDECNGLLALLRDGIPQLLRQQGLARPALLATAERAAQAVASFQRYLAHELRYRSSDAYACGAEALERYIKRGHFLQASAEEIAALAEEQIAQYAASLAERAAEFGAGDLRAALGQLADIHPSAEGYLQRYAELWQDCRALAERRGLVTWPDAPIRFVPRPSWVRSAAPHLYFLFYHAPAPLDQLPELEYLVTPIEPGMPPEDQERLLRATNESVIKLNHVVHHGALGHHVQNWYAARAESRIGQVAAVDCAARIAMFCGGTMAEGWACYATDLMEEAGFLTPLEQLSELHGRLRMAARALADVRLHSGAWTLSETAAFYQERVGMAPAAAQGEAVKNSMFPGTALMYLMGSQAIHSLRGELAAQPGFELRAFHDRLLSFGSLPVALIAEEMRRATA